MDTASFKSLELTMQVAVYRMAITAIFSTLSSTQRNVALASFKSLSEHTHRLFDNDQIHPKTIELYKDSCARVMNDMSIELR
ncbi:hypothetical protein [Herbaspirillum huttiense]|uniref:hypothetical protein n=1 Tax=Herbaspirillum huttiense TaxID=863372 RepID=UPI0031D5A1D0